MKLIGIFITGIAAGVLGGMGMGGGTLLIPALTTIFGVDQKLSQAINLTAFVPMAAVALFIHAKNGLVKTKGMIPLASASLVFSVGASFLEKIVKGSFQKKAFGIFLIVLALWQGRQLRKAGNKPENDGLTKNDERSPLYAKNSRKRKKSQT